MKAQYLIEGFICGACSGVYAWIAYQIWNPVPAVISIFCMLGAYLSFKTAKSL